eukprot:scaffold31709_cov41-Cyclotella_meneghiniana.AAC.4
MRNSPTLLRPVGISVPRVLHNRRPQQILRSGATTMISCIFSGCLTSNINDIFSDPESVPYATKRNLFEDYQDITLQRVKAYEEFFGSGCLMLKLRHHLGYFKS